MIWKVKVNGEKVKAFFWDLEKTKVLQSLAPVTICLLRSLVWAKKSYTLKSES